MDNNLLSQLQAAAQNAALQNQAMQQAAQLGQQQASLGGYGLPNHITLGSSAFLDNKQLSVASNETIDKINNSLDDLIKFKDLIQPLMYEFKHLETYLKYIKLTGGYNGNLSYLFKKGEEIIFPVAGSYIIVPLHKRSSFYNQILDGHGSSHHNLYYKSLAYRKGDRITASEDLYIYYRQ